MYRINSWKTTSSDVWFSFVPLCLPIKTIILSQQFVRLAESGIDVGADPEHISMSHGAHYYGQLDGILPCNPISR